MEKKDHPDQKRNRKKADDIDHVKRGRCIGKNIPKSHLFLEEDMPMNDVPQIFAVSNLWFKAGLKDAIGTFDLVIRDLPVNRRFMVLTGVEEAIVGILDYRFPKKGVDYLLKTRVISPEFAEYLINFRFSGEVFAMKEGSVFFPNEPVLRVTAPIIEGNLLTAFLMNAICSNTIFSTKVVRSIIAAGGRPVIGPSVMRGQSFESVMKCSRSSYIAGSIITSPAFALKYKIPVLKDPIINAYHAYIKSMPDELEAMRRIAEEYENVYLMIDTFCIETGLRNAITVAKELKAKGRSLLGVVIDSGDLKANSIMVKRNLIKNGLNELKICAASNLDEYKIKELISQKAPIDSFLVVTELITSADDPKLEIVYKLSQLQHHGKTKELAKLSSGKVSYPGLKNVYRSYKRGVMDHDTIGLENEGLGEPLLVKMIDKGRLIMNLPSLEEIRKYQLGQLKMLPEDLLEIKREESNKLHYPVYISGGLDSLLRGIVEEHNMRD